MDTRSERRRRLPWLPLLGVLALLLAAACNRGSDDDGGGASAGGAGPPRGGGLRNVGLHHRGGGGDFEIVAYQTGGGLTAERMQFSAVLDHGKPVVLNFWAGLCPPCRAEMPEFQEVYDEYSDRILMLGIDLGPFTGLGNSDQGRALLSELGVSYPAGTTEDADVVAHFQVLGMPTTLFVTADGGVVAKWTGILTKEKLVEHVEELLAVAER